MRQNHVPPPPRWRETRTPGGRRVAGPCPCPGAALRGGVIAPTGPRQSRPRGRTAGTCGHSAGAKNFRLRGGSRAERRVPPGHPEAAWTSSGQAARPLQQSLWSQPHGPRMPLVPERHGWASVGCSSNSNTLSEVCACHNCEFQVCLSRASVIFKLSFGVQEVKRDGRNCNLTRH